MLDVENLVGRLIEIRVQGRVNTAEVLQAGGSPMRC